MSTQTLEVQQKFALLGETVQSFCIGAIPVDAGASLEQKVAELSTLIKLTNYNLITLKAKYGETLLPEDEICPPLDVIAGDLNTAVDTAVLQEQALTTAVVSAVLCQDAAASDSSSAKAMSKNSQYLKQYEMVTEMQKVMKLMLQVQFITIISKNLF